MKLIIDLPEKTIAHIRSNYGHGYKGLYDEDRDIIAMAIYTGKPYENTYGEWIDKGSLSCRCSECGCKNDRESNFCPNCGQRMKVKEKEYVCAWGLTVKVKARSDVEAKKRCADLLSNDFFTSVYPEDVEIVPESGKGE